MTIARDLRALFASDENLPSLRRLYFTTLRLIREELQKVPFRPSPGRVGEILRRIREIAARIDPKASSPVRRWIEREVVMPFKLGDRWGIQNLESMNRKTAEGMSPAARVALNSFKAQVTQKLQSVYLQVLQTAEYAARRVQMFMGTSQETTSGIVRSAEGRALAQDVADVIRLGDQSEERKKRLILAGFFVTDYSLLSGLASNYWLSSLKIRTSVVTNSTTRNDYVSLVIEGRGRQAANKAIELRGKQAGVNYVVVNRNPQIKDVCALFIGQVYHTSSGLDPLAFPYVGLMPGGGQLPQHPRCQHWFNLWDPERAGTEEVRRKKILSDLVPRRFLGMPADKASEEVRAMSLEELRAIAPMAFGEGAEDNHPALKGAPEGAAA